MNDNNNNIPDINNDSNTTESNTTESVAAPAVAPDSKDDSNTIADSTESKDDSNTIVGSNSDVSKDDDSNTIALGSNSDVSKDIPESKDDSNTNEYAEAIETVTELLNKLNSAAADASDDDADDFKKAIDIATELLNKLNAAANPVTTVTPVAPVTDGAPVTPVTPVTPDTPVVGAGCGQRAAIWSSADPSCFVVKDLPPIAQMIQAAFANEVSTAGREIVMNFLKAAGIKGIESAVLTPETIRQLDELSKNPEMEAKIKALKLNLDNVAEQAMNNIEKNVAPKAEEVLGGIEANLIGGLDHAIAGIPLVGEMEAVGNAIDVMEKTATEIPDIGKEIKDELKPLQDLKNSIPVLPDVAGAASDAASAATNAAASTASAATNAAASTASTASDAASAAGAAASTASDAAGAATKIGGSRRIHRLSRRIDKLSRRIQKKYGLKDKNSFLRRTLKK